MDDRDENRMCSQIRVSLSGPTLRNTGFDSPQMPFYGLSGEGGTSSIVHETTHQPLLSTLSAIVETVVRLRAAGHKVVLVSSGAIGVGLQRMAISSRPKSVSGKQALAAIGQGRLIALWDNLFGQLGQPIAQVLLTRGDISDVSHFLEKRKETLMICTSQRTRYLNAVNTFKELLAMGVVPIVNENDTVSVSEIKFGDNDTLSAITSSMIHADYLFLFTDVDGLYTANPRKDPSAQLIEVVESTHSIRAQVSTATLGSSLGTGGMETKLIAAEIATAAGVSTIITSSRNPASLFAILEYHGVTVGPGSSDANPATRPLHTLFTPSAMPLRDLKAWTRHTLTPAGGVVIDSGAHIVLSRRESGGRLLPAGVLSIHGAFASGQAVRILVRKKAAGANSEDTEVACEEYVRGLAPTQPGTPQTTDHEIVVDTSAVGQDLRSVAMLPVIEGNAVSVEEGVVDGGQWEVEEVGRGLANYNSAQVDQVKGLNSGYLAQLLGYADSEYVVENVTIFVPRQE
ncbi:glutamate 5-kinase [Russula earlei]|uniref:Glutamate 5-kinase n=1 Tax=Russula earlei TaxID=71964 RepID=A0ACC0U5V2_9AGAM|nr:glutamate 5-kinase [Russula earlei]